MFITNSFFVNNTAKYVSRGEGKRWTYDEARNMISESIEMSQSMESAELQKLVEEQNEMYPLGPCIALAFLSVLKDCESHCSNEGLEVKSLGGLHVIGTSLHESRRIDNQVSSSIWLSFRWKSMFYPILECKMIFLNFLLLS